MTTSTDPSPSRDAASDDILVLGGPDIDDLLLGREAELIELVSQAYAAHQAGRSSLPHSIFLRFPDNERDRIIGLPAYLGDDFGVAGMKWIASFPGNLERGLARASAVLILNSCETGRPTAILESSIISARRTAASAALAARELVADRGVASAGLVGTGLINLEVARFLKAALPSLERFVLFDLDRERAAGFAERLGEVLGASAEIAGSVEEVLEGESLTAFATTAIRPHIDDLSICPQGATLLHVSLRDLTPRAVLAADNVVDDADHVSRAQTSIHLAEQETGHRDFIRATLAEVVAGTAPAKADRSAVTVFSPFGLGVLDLALGQLALELAREEGLGTSISGFIP